MSLLKRPDKRVLYLQAFLLPGENGREESLPVCASVSKITDVFMEATGNF